MIGVLRLSVCHAYHARIRASLSSVNSVIAHVCTNRCVARVIGGVREFVRVRALKENQLELSTPILVHMLSMTGPRRVDPEVKRSKVKGHGYENRHGCAAGH